MSITASSRPVNDDGSRKRNREESHTVTSSMGCMTLTSDKLKVCKPVLASVSMVKFAGQVAKAMRACEWAVASNTFDTTTLALALQYLQLYLSIPESMVPGAESIAVVDEYALKFPGTIDQQPSYPVVPLLPEACTAPLQQSPAALARVLAQHTSYARSFEAPVFVVNVRWDWSRYMYCQPSFVHTLATTNHPFGKAVAAELFSTLADEFRTARVL